MSKCHIVHCELLLFIAMMWYTNTLRRVFDLFDPFKEQYIKSNHACKCSVYSMQVHATRLLDDIVYQVERINLIFQGSRNGFLPDQPIVSTQLKDRVSFFIRKQNVKLYIKKINLETFFYKTLGEFNSAWVYLGT